MRLISVVGLGLVVPCALAFHGPVVSSPATVARGRGKLLMVGGPRAPTNAGASLAQQGFDAISVSGMGL